MEYLTIHSNMSHYRAALFNFEGELMNVIVKNPTDFKVGDKILCEFDTFQTEATILKKEENNLFLFVSIDHDEFESRRKSIRCEAQFPGFLYMKEPLPISIQVINISINGMALIAEKNLSINSNYDVSFNIEGKQIIAEITVKNAIQQLEGYRYGVELALADKKDLYYIRRYILQYQLNHI